MVFINPAYGRQSIFWPMRIVATIFKESCWKGKICKKKKLFFCAGNFTPCVSKSFQIWDPFFPLLFPKDSKNTKKSWDIGHREMGAKRRSNWVKKWKNMCEIFFLPQRLYTLYEKKFSNLRPLLSIKQKKRYRKILLSKAKFAQKLTFLRINFTPYSSKSFQIRDHFFP